MPDRETDPTARPSAANALVGVAGVGVRALGAAASVARGAARAATGPAVAVTRAGLTTPPARALRNDARGLLDALDDAGAEDIERARERLDRALDRTIDRAVEDVLSSERTKRVVERVLESDQLWQLVDRIANSPEVLNAVASTSVGLTGVVADEARRRTITADEFAERIARRVLRRSPRRPHVSPVDPAAGEPVSPQP